MQEQLSTVLLAESEDSEDHDNSDDEEDDGASDEDVIDSTHVDQLIVHDKKMDFLIDLYLLADKLIDPTTANFVIDALINVVNIQPKPGVVTRVYSSTADGNHLRKHLRDLYLHASNLSWLQSREKAAWGLPHEFVQGLMIEICRLHQGRPVKTRLRINPVNQKGHYHQKVQQITEV